VAPEVLREKNILEKVIFMDLELLHMKSAQGFLLIMILLMIISKLLAFVKDLD
jgi:hypothetical protein